jgi:hypothetical protein
MRAPDYVEPIVGWRLWHVVERQGALRLLSPLYRTLWTPRQELVAACRRGVESMVLSISPGAPRHSPPHGRCSCGIYASQTPAQAAAYLSRLFRQREDVLCRVIGHVSLWGTVVECERGWRASHAYPARIYVLAPQRRGLAFLTGPRPALPPEQIASALADYGVPVEIVDARSLRGIANALDPAGGSSAKEAA